nr:RNA-directed DNA polymerase, eukaryota [Tanacetum cinerariifolium]
MSDQVLPSLILDDWCILDRDFSLSLMGKSGDIICVWEPTLIVKDDIISFDNFLAIIEKRVLSDYILHLIDQWDGDFVIMGDFNKVKMEQEIYGSIFNVQGANVFNSFISLASRINLPLYGYAFAWAYKTTNKISDENIKFFHGILNSKHSELAIHGTFVDGEWIVDSLAMKSVFLKYFSTQFSSLVSARICFADQLTNWLSLEQQADLKRNLSNAKIKNAI